MFEKHETQLLAKLSEYLTEVATLSNAVGRAALSSSTSALDAVRQPAVAVDHFGFVLDANAAAHCIFDADIRIRLRRLWFADPQARRCLEDLFERLPSGCAELSGLFPIVVGRTDKPPVIVNVFPVPAAARNPFVGACVIVTLVSIEPKPRPSSSLLSKAFGLTSAEAKLASFIADGTSLEDAARELAISRETARSHLKVVFAKTDTHRQSELVALLSRL
jgi:DNA-binding CsgD family transcriptional regulator